MFFTRRQLSASLAVAIWTFIIFTSITTVSGQPKLVFTLPDDPIRQDDDAKMACSVDNLPANLSVTIFRPNSLPLTWNDNVLSSDERIRIDVSDNVYVLTIANVTEDDAGEYICQVIDSDYKVVSKTSVELELGETFYFPEADPVCLINSPSNRFEEGSDISFSCTSADGNPPVLIAWAGLKGRTFETPIPVRADDTITSNVTFKASMANHNNVYICYITSIGFLHTRRSCSIGPLVIVPRSGRPQTPESSGVTESAPVVQTTSGAKSTTSDFLSSPEPTEFNATKVPTTEVSDTISTTEATSTSNSSDSEQYPLCESSSENQVVEGTEVTLNCTSKVTDPPAKVYWGEGPKGGQQEFNLKSSPPVIDGDIQTSTYKFNASLEDQNQVFTCYIVGELSFLDIKRCVIGPFEITHVNTSVEVISNTTDSMISTTQETIVTTSDQYFPDYPLCESSSENQVAVGSEITLNCTSQIGNPPVSIYWGEGPEGGRQEFNIETLPPVKNGQTLTSTYTFTASRDNHNNIFTCYIVGPLFRNIKTCIIGPFEVTGSSVDEQTTNAPQTTGEVLTTEHNVFPQNPPRCYSSLQEPTPVGTTVTISCVSEDGNPPVNLEWAISLKRLESPPLRRYRGPYVSSELTYTVLAEDHYAVFVCYASSPGYPEYVQTCQIGPIQVQQISTSPRPATMDPSFYFPDIEPRCESTIPNPIQEDSVVTFSCTTEDGNPPVTIDWAKGGSYVRTSPAVRSNGLVVSEITARVSREDQGAFYLCYVTSEAFPEMYQTCYIGPLQIIESPNPTVPVTTQIPVPEQITPTTGEYFPQRAPLCQSTVPNPITEGYTYTIRCTSPEGNPPVEIDWVKSGQRVEQLSPPTREGGFVTSEITIRASRNDNGATYICYVTSRAFPESFETCYIGPIEIQPNPYLPSAVTTLTPEGLTAGMVTSFIGQTNTTASIIERCEEFCYAFPDLE